ncbi:conserved exported hypothetical protein [Bradyrhizobium oligotrophicum S58]|uniref:Uncharacterized protein n=2 Tax=Bradyrhizobium oligotrophicum TaxID=44255 RepID=M4ZF63_9BRAD|nr:hypothetical protein [Bradyrhizobium oligotrophicum]BAM92492.1 conserved exported hypothetical protein [Bradyrhizobium oligotrophicum S58]
MLRARWQPMSTSAIVAVAVAMLSLVGVPSMAAEPQLLPPVTVDLPDRPPASPLLPGQGDAAAAPVLGGRTPTPGDKPERCTGSASGQQGSFGCINESLKRKVDAVNPLSNQPPIDASSSDLKVGTVNIPAVRQQYGANFGRSVVPYRPTAIFPSGVGRR